MNTIEVIRNIFFFAGFNDDELLLISKICKIEKFSKETIIFNEGDSAKSFYLIIKGQIKIMQNLGKVGSEELVVLKPGECLGEMALIDGETRSASALASIDTKLLTIKKEDLDILMDKNLFISVKILKNFCSTLSNRLRVSNKHLSDMSGLLLPI